MQLLLCKINFWHCVALESITIKTVERDYLILIGSKHVLIQEIKSQHLFPKLVIPNKAKRKRNYQGANDELKNDYHIFYYDNYRLLPLPKPSRKDCVR